MSIPYQIYGRICACPELAKTEYWVEFPSELELSNYLVSTFGNIYSKCGKRIMAGFGTGDYYEVSLVNDNKKNTKWKVHRLVAITFIPNPDNKETVDHISHVRENNNVMNLQWATHSEQNVNRTPHRNKGRSIKVIRKALDGTRIDQWESMRDAATAVGKKNSSRIGCACREGIPMYGYLWSFVDDEYDENFEGEEWKPVPGYDNTLASSKGRIKNINGVIYQGSLLSGYKRVSIRDKDLKVHKLVCLAFHGPAPVDGKRYLVNHKNGNKLDNTPENLEWVTDVENTTHAYENGLINTKTGRRCKPVLQYTLDGKLVAEYKSYTEARDTTGINNISLACSGSQHTAGNYIWKWKNTYDHIVPLTTPLEIPTNLMLTAPVPEMTIDQHKPSA